MPRKTGQAAKKEASESKNESITPRRSGRAVTKVEVVTPVKDASRSRRSSTAAQTVASVADSKSPRGRSSRRDSISPSDSRSRSGLESPATRVKATRRNTGRINYKESDGEEEAQAPKFDENFDSGEEFEESDSDEKSKPRGKGRQIKTSKVSPKQKTESGSRGRRGRPSKRRANDSKPVEISDDSMEPEIVETKPATTDVRDPVLSRSSRGRKPKAEIVDVESEAKSKPSRRSARSSSSKEVAPKKRPSRSIQAKRYTEDDEEDIEEITDSKSEEADKPEANRKRKRGSSPEESNKRLKEETIETDKNEEIDKEPVIESKLTEAKLEEEPMEVEECDSGILTQEESENQDKDLPVAKEKEKDIALDKEPVSHSLPQTKDTSKNEEKQADIESAEKTIEETSSESKPEIALPKEPVKTEKIEEKNSNGNVQTIKEKKPENLTAVSISEATKSESSEPEIKLSSTVVSDSNSESSNFIEKEKQKSSETHANDHKDFESSESKVDTPVINAITENKVSPAVVHPATSGTDSTFNGTEKLTNSVDANTVTQAPSINADEAVATIPKANGAHDGLHESTTLTQEQFILPGRKYVLNSKLNENILQTIKSKAFGFLSYNLGSDFNVQKDKLLHELHELNSQVICLQQVPKPFYLSVLQPSLDALGYKSIFSQPLDNLKGMATFFKTSQFRLNEQSEISFRQLIDKELETSALEPISKAAVKSYIKRCGNALLTHFASVLGTQTVTVVNVQIPPSELSSHALQVSCLARELIRINGGSNKPLLIGGEFNISEKDASYQLLRDGYLSNDMIDELQRRKDIVVPDKENSSLVDLLWKSFQHPSSNLCSCYSSVLGHELLIPELKSASSDLLWYSSDSLHTVGIVDVESNKLGDHHFSLKADIAFSV